MKVIALASESEVSPTWLLARATAIAITLSESSSLTRELRKTAKSLTDLSTKLQDVD